MRTHLLCRLLPYKGLIFCVVFYSIEGFTEPPLIEERGLGPPLIEEEPPFPGYDLCFEYPI